MEFQVFNAGIALLVSFSGLCFAICLWGRMAHQNILIRQMAYFVAALSTSFGLRAALQFDYLQVSVFAIYFFEVLSVFFLSRYLRGGVLQLKQNKMDSKDILSFKTISIGTTLFALAVILENIFSASALWPLNISISNFIVIGAITSLSRVYFVNKKQSLSGLAVNLSVYFVFSLVSAQILTNLGLSLGPYTILSGVLFASLLVFDSLNVQIFSNWSESKTYSSTSNSISPGWGKRSIKQARQYSGTSAENSIATR